jgi:hypothetical protein
MDRVVCCPALPTTTATKRLHIIRFLLLLPLPLCTVHLSTVWILSTVLLSALYHHLLPALHLLLLKFGIIFVVVIVLSTILLFIAPVCRHRHPVAIFVVLRVICGTPLRVATFVEPVISPLFVVSDGSCS